jgi:hypothetical protein
MGVFLQVLISRFGKWVRYISERREAIAEAANSE